MTRHNFRCNKDKLTFGFDSDLADINRFKKKLKRGVRCPECDDEWGAKGSNITHELPFRDKTKDKEKLRRTNIQASSDAKVMAAKYAAGVGTPEMVNVKRPKDSRNPGNITPGAPVERLPKSVVDSLQFKQGVDPNKK